MSSHGSLWRHFDPGFFMYLSSISVPTSQFSYQLRTIACQLRPISVPTSYQLRTNFVRTLYQFRTNCVPTSCQLRINFVPTLYRLRTWYQLCTNFEYLQDYMSQFGIHFGATFWSRFCLRREILKKKLAFPCTQFRCASFWMGQAEAWSHDMDAFCSRVGHMGVRSGSSKKVEQ